MYDIAVIGLGPAGATLARLLDKRFRVIAIDKKSDRPDSFRKPCGGLLAPDAQKALARFNLTLPKDVLVDPQIFSVKTLDLDSGLVRDYQRLYLNVDRQKFDLWLMGLIPDRVTLETDAVCTGIRREDKSFRVRYVRAGQEREIAARYLVGGDGANSLVRRTLFPQAQPRAYVAIQQWFQEENPRPFYACIFDSQNTDCYSWAVSKDGYFIFGGAYPAQDCRARFEAQKTALERRGFVFGPDLRTEGCQVLRPRGYGDFCTGGDGAFLVGEAAGFVSPSSLEGISAALLSGSFLSRALQDGGDPNRAYNRQAAGLKRKLAAKNLKCPFLFRPGLRRLVMESGLRDIHKRENQP